MNKTIIYKQRRPKPALQKIKLDLIRIYLNKAIITEAATVVPITPATLGPIACINIKLPSFSFWATTLATRAAIGTADKPAPPIKGLRFAPVILFSNLVNNTPPAVLTINAIKPKRTISMVWKFKKYLASMVEPTQIPKKIVKILISEFWAVSDKRGTTRLSLNKFPTINIPMIGTEGGNTRPTNIVLIIGNNILSVRETGLSCFISILLSALVVSNFKIGG